jgi:hypothetical protein
VILFYQWGGPSQLETYDLKTSAPSEYRSLFRRIATNVPGIEICERFPRQAAQRAAVFRLQPRSRVAVPLRGDKTL